MESTAVPLAPEYTFYIPDAGRTVTTGAEELPLELPRIPLPVEMETEHSNDEPTDKQIGVSLYNYLRRFPDCPYCQEYAQLLRQAFPYYLTDIASQIIMLEAKDVDAPYIRRKINYLKILVLLEPENPLLRQKLGIAYFELGMVYVELINIRREFSHALNSLQAALRFTPKDTTTLNVLGQISYLMGDYPSGMRYWQGVVDQIPDCDAKTQLKQRISVIESGQHPSRPLIDDLEAVGIAMEHFSAEEFIEASELMDRLEEEGSIPRELPSPEFYFFLGLCREKRGEHPAAFEAYTKALEIDPEHQASIDAIDRVTTDPGNP